MLKKAGEMSAALDKNQASGSGQQPAMDIPVVNFPDYPDRTPRTRGPIKPAGTMSQQQKQGLTAPSAADISSSGPKMQQVSPTHNSSLFMISHN